VRPNLGQADAASDALADDERLDLDTRIRRAEQRLLANEARWLGEFEALTEGVQRTLHLGHLLKPVLGAGLAAAGAWWALRKRSGAVRGRAADEAIHGAGGRAARPATRGAVSGAFDLPWVQMLGAAWPLMPARVRDRVSPAMASTVLSLGLPVAERLLAKGRAQPLDTMPAVDLARCAGTWFVVAGLPGMFDHASAARRPRARVLPQRDGSIRLVLRSQGSDGSVHDVQGLARPEPGSGGARLAVSVWPQALRWLPMAWQQQGVLHIDEACTEAVVGSVDRRQLWLLARRPRLAEERVHALVQLALDRGFAVRRLQFTEGDS
jgi:apolipoprotein D and lipocalin family protein